MRLFEQAPDELKAALEEEAKRDKEDATAKYWDDLKGNASRAPEVQQE